MSVVYAKSNAPDDVLAAVRKGHVMVLGGLKAPRILLNADTNNDGLYDDAMPGDTLPADTKGPIRFQVAIEKASPTDRLFLVDRDGEFYTGQVGVGDGWKGNVYRFSRSFKTDVPNFVRAELRQQDAKTMESLTNPIYLPVKRNTTQNNSSK